MITVTPYDVQDMATKYDSTFIADWMNCEGNSTALNEILFLYLIPGQYIEIGHDNLH
jgi:hypothetical protein